ncbi:MAG TPA: alanine-zipper protein [Gemmatimonadales bacterium]|nr:alanine-zipper protein [Gemmatimonadales bacterium]
MAFVWDLIQQIQLHNTKSRAKSASSTAKTAQSRAKAAESRARSLESRVAELEEEVGNMRTTLAVLLDRLERRFGPEAEKLGHV